MNESQKTTFELILLLGGILIFFGFKTSNFWTVLFQPHKVQVQPITLPPINLLGGSGPNNVLGMNQKQ